MQGLCPALSPLPLLACLLVLMPMPTPAAGADPQCRDQLPAGRCWITEDVIDGRIDHHAQSALMGMLSRGGIEAADASAILCAVKRGELEGVFLPDQQVPALRAKADNSGWWLIIPEGASSTCYLRPAGSRPLIAFSKGIKDQPGQVAVALGNAWQNCAIPPTAARCYTATISKPAEPPLPDTPTTPPALGETALVVTLFRSGSVYDGLVRVFAANRKDQFIQSGRGSVRILLEPGAYNTAAHDLGIHGCPLSAPQRVVVEQGKTAFVTIEVPEC